MKSPKVSIITPVYNSEVTIKETLESAAKQSFKDWELIVAIDSGTKDNTRQIVNDFRAHDPRIQLLDITDGRGVAHARNQAILKSKGVYLSFLDSDDLWRPEKLQTQVQIMDRENFDFTYTGFQRIQFDGTPVGKDVLPPGEIDYNELLKCNSIPCLTVMIRKAAFQNISFIEKRHEDYILWLKLLRQGKKAYPINEVLADYRLMPQSRGANKWESVYWTWRIYRDEENLSFPEASKNFLHYISRKITFYLN